MSDEVDYIEFYQQHVQGLKSVGKDEFKGHCPFTENHPNGDKNPSFSVNSQTGQYRCFSCDAKGNLKTFCKAKGLSYPGQQAKGRWVDPEITFDYRDEKGVLLYQSCRFPGKKFSQRRPGGQGKWKYQTKDVRKVPYRLPELLKADPDKVVFIPEGEKHVDRLNSLGLVATCNVGGAEKWTPDLNQHLKDRKVCILPDNDLPGQRHGKKVAENLHSVARGVKILDLPGLKQKGDIINWLDDGHTKEELLKLAEQAEPWKQEKAELNKDDALIEGLNKKHAVVMIGGKCLILNEVHDYTFNRPDITLSTPTDFKNFYANCHNSEGVRLGKFWFDHKNRRQYDGITFAPLQNPPGQYNLWRGFAVEPKEGDCSLYLEHIRNNIAKGVDEHHEYIIAWMADAVQNPNNRPGTSIVCRGKQGVGKGIAVSEFGKLFGSHFVHVQNSRHLVGNFNAHLKDALMVFADEAFWAGDKAAEGVLKAMVTEERITIEPKGKDAFQIKNNIRLMISSNNDWIVPAGLEERRFFVIDVSDNHMQDHDYFKKIVDQMNNGGREALLYYLQHYNLSNIDLRSFPMTMALWETKTHSMTPIQKFWFSKLEAGSQLNGSDEWIKKPIAVDQIQKEFLEYAGKMGKKYKGDETELGIMLKKLVPNLKKVRPIGTDSVRYYAYKFPPLEECRADWEKMVNTKFGWPKKGGSLLTPTDGFLDEGDE